MHPAARAWTEAYTVITSYGHLVSWTLSPLLGPAYWQRSQRLRAVAQDLPRSYARMARQATPYVMLVESDVPGWRPGLLP
jgi:hypothetical protein